MAERPTSGMGSQSMYKGMVTGGSGVQTDDYAAGADSQSWHSSFSGVAMTNVMHPKSNRSVTGYVEYVR